MKNALPSKKQHALLAYIDAFIAENNYAPSYREVMKALDYKSVSTVATHINGLIERGWLIKRENEKRSLEVVYTAAGEAGNSVDRVSPAPSLPSAKPKRSVAELMALLEAARARVEVGAVYTHYKGGSYTVTDVVIQTIDDEVGVVYRANYGDNIMFVRPLSEWLETVEVSGENVPRFSKN